MSAADFVRVYSTGSITDGYLAKGRLEADGIPVLIKGEGEGPYRMGPVYLWVPAELEVQARMILDEAERSGSGDDGDEARADWSEDEA
ncbi:MAG TPA: DUF2007 domain-containing protein [Actinomycetota bacterium]